MAMKEWHRLALVDALYGGALFAAMAQGRSPTTLSLSMGVFALLIFVVDWVETRGIVDRTVQSGRDEAITFALTLPMLATWGILATRGPRELALYFGLLAGYFFLQAVRDAVVLDISPVGLLARGYANLVAVYLVFGAAVSAVDRLQVVLVMLAGFVYVVRKSFRWTGAILDWIVGDVQYENN
jgi:hypothetical protein